MSKKVKKKRKPNISRVGATDRLLRAAGKYLEVCGGTAIVAGPISIISWPGELRTNFMLAIKIFGRKPEKGNLQ
jgi:hypothetical protein